MLQAYSQTEQALRDTCLRYADEESFDALAKMYGWPRPPGISVKAWRAALRVALWGTRGTFLTLFAFLKEALSDFNTVSEQSWQVNHPNNPDNLHDIGSADTVADNGLKTLYRKYRLSIPIHSNPPTDQQLADSPLGLIGGRTVGRYMVATLPDQTELLTRIVREYYKGSMRWVYVPNNATSYWTRPTDNPLGKFRAEILPFTLEEPNPDSQRSLRYMKAKAAQSDQWNWWWWQHREVDDFMNAHHRVVLTIFSDLKDVLSLKTTYLQHDGSEFAEDKIPNSGKHLNKIWFPDPDTGKPMSGRPDNQPKGGQLQADETKLGDPNGLGPYPPYLADPDGVATTKNRLFHAISMLMPDGCHLVVRPAPVFPSGASSIKGPTAGKDPKMRNEPAGSIPNSLQN